MKGIFTMNKLTSTLLFAGALLLGGCTHTSTQAKTTPVVAVAAPVVVATAPTPTPVDQPDEGPQPHQAPFKGNTWVISDVSQNWLGLEADDGNGLIAVNPVDVAKVIMVTKPATQSLATFAAGAKANLAEHGVTITGQKNVKVNGVSGIQLDTHQGKLRVLITFFSTGGNAYLFGCAQNVATNAKTCNDFRSGLHLNK
jgi:hypothetical protein